VLTYNLRARYGSFDDAIAIIHEADADIVVLQEVFDPAEAALREALADEYPHTAIHTTEIPTQGQAVLSRYPILEDEFIRSHLGHQRTLLEIGGRQIAVYNVHPAHPGMVALDVSRRTEDIGRIIEMAQADAPAMPVIFAGDFNMTPNTADYARITETFTDAHREAGFGLGYTFPGDAPLPLARIDYVFHDADWRAVDARVWDRTGGSDHYPVYARLALLAE
jgi:endonuclease/exonuclease/phosphatase (EEP) superfamily protein YafD